MPTGVKHLHHAAQSYPIGVYFEANGHGTVLFSPATLSLLASAPASPARDSLLALAALINQTVGDALSDMLLVEAVLLHRQWSPAQWDKAYTDLPNRLVRVFVEDRHAFEVRDAERVLVKPEGLQKAVDDAVGKVEKGRSFVRPSGTEDCVRVYAEAATRELADGACFSPPFPKYWSGTDASVADRARADRLGDRFRQLGQGRQAGQVHLGGGGWKAGLVKDTLGV